MWKEITDYFKMYTDYFLECKRNYNQYVTPFFYLKNYKRMFKWLSVIWNDREWDYLFLLDILKHKLENDSVYYENDGVTVNSKKVAKQMKMCIALIDRISKDDYSMFMLDKLDEKYGKFIFLPTEREGYTSLTRENLKDNEKLHEQYRKDSKRFMEYEVYMRKQDKEYLFNTMKKHIFRWWD